MNGPEDILRALVACRPSSHGYVDGYCSLCGNWGVSREVNSLDEIPSQHLPDCPYRMAVEFLAEKLQHLIDQERKV